MTPRLIIFDCDGTLADGQHMIVSAMQSAFAELEMAPPSREAVLYTVGLSPLEGMQHLAGTSDPLVHEALAAEYRTHFQALRRMPNFEEPLFPGAKQAIQHLASLPDIVLGIATGKSQRGVRALLEREALTSAFATIQTADDAPSKPHPGMIWNALAETGLSAAATVMIGDTTHDILMARSAGVKSIGVAWGYHQPAELLGAGASTVAENFAELLNLLGVGAVETPE
ncbi:MAG: HAD-IA family hydrolase [Chitinophagales bacterium]|nr:HAD-IA family hydrolase [Hyphomicrobiales bacterium]